MATKKLLGINFGLEALDLVEVDKQKIISTHHVPYVETQDKAEVTEVADEIRLAAVLQRTLRDKKIETLESLITVPSNEILLRSFSIPILPRDEIKTAIDFEARKYVPIKLDDLCFDYLLKKIKEKNVKKFRTHFIGIKKEVLKKFVYALEQSNLKPLSIETSPFSLFRALLYKKLTKANSNIAIVEVSKHEGNICIIDGGFPELIRDFKFTDISKDIYSQEPDTLSSHLNKEVRLSFDYFRRQVQKEKVEQIFLFTEEQDAQLKDNLNKEFNIPVIMVDPKSILDLDQDVPVGALKAFGTAIKNSVSSPISIDLSKKKQVVELKEKADVIQTEVPVSLQSVTRTAIIAGCFVLLFYLFVDFSQISALNKKLNSLIQARQAIKHEVGTVDLITLKNLEADYQEQIVMLQEAKQTTFLTPLLNALPSLIPNGVWLTSISFSFDPAASLKLDGSAYSENVIEQSNLVNKFFNNMKNNEEFKSTFGQIDLDFIRQRTSGEFELTEFGITGRK